MATFAAGCSTSRARRAASRSSYIPRFYRALHSQTAASYFTASNEHPVNPGLYLPQGAGPADPELPQGCYLVERLIAARKNKGNSEYILFCGRVTQRRRHHGYMKRTSLLLPSDPLNHRYHHIE